MPDAVLHLFVRQNRLDAIRNAEVRMHQTHGGRFQIPDILRMRQAKARVPVPKVSPLQEHPEVGSV